MKYALRAGTAISTLGLCLSFALAWILGEASPFVVVAPIAVGGKWAENLMERRKHSGNGSKDPDIKAVK